MKQALRGEAGTFTTLFTSRNGGQGGACYTPEWVWKIKRGFHRYSDPNWGFRFLTDVCPSPWQIRLRNRWPGWWAKMELFRPHRFPSPVMYVDLDTLLVGHLGELQGYEGDFAILEDVYYRERYQSSVMMWRPGDHTRELWDRFSSDPNHYMIRFRSDQEFIEDTFRTHGYEADFWQDLYPGRVVSFKVHAKEDLPEGAALICGHGRPRLSDPEAGWAHEAWEMA